MKKQLGLLAVLLLLVGGVSQAALVNVTGANYVVTEVYRDRNAFGVDLVQNGPRETRTEIRLKPNARCYWVVPRGKGQDQKVSVASFMRNLRKGDRVSVNGGRDWDGKINASHVWAQ